MKGTRILRTMTIGDGWSHTNYLVPTDNKLQNIEVSDEFLREFDTSVDGYYVIDKLEEREYYVPIELYRTLSQ